MKAIVFGSTGFIGSHVVEQLAFSGHDVSAAVRSSGDTSFLRSLNIPVAEVDFTGQGAIEAAIAGHDVVYNCTANPKVHQSLEGHRKVEVRLTGRIAEAAARAGAKRFIQLSTVMVYGFDMPARPVDEDYPCKPEYPFQQACLEREEAVKEAAKRTGLETVILRPSSTIGARDRSFFKAMYKAHKENKYPIIGDGSARFSCIDTRDIGRAMVWLGGLDGAGGQTYLVKGFDISYNEIKNELDKVRGVSAKVQKVPKPVAMTIGAVSEWLTPYSKEPMLTRFTVRAITATRLFDDSKIRGTGFSTIYGFSECIREAASDQEKRINVS